MTNAPDNHAALPKFSLQFLCPKCGSDKCGTRLEQAEETSQDRARRQRLSWPPGELMIQSCQICGHVRISRPLDYQESSDESTKDKMQANVAAQKRAEGT